jgi:indole-3-glycerol phosphate synthase
MNDFLDVLARNAQRTIESGYYQKIEPTKTVNASLKKAIAACSKNPVITEIKPASPTLGTIRQNFNPAEIAKAMEKGGAAGISVLTEPKHFHGALSTLTQARQATKLPLLMKDIVIIPEQVEAAARAGANAVLLILGLFDGGYCEVSIEKMISLAHSKGLEVLLETHTENEFQAAVETEADLVGINNRDLTTLKINLETTKKILEKHRTHGKTVVSESGICSPKDLQFLRCTGVSAFLIGSSIMLSENVEEKVREFVLA